MECDGLDVKNPSARVEGGSQMMAVAVVECLEHDE